MKTMFAKATFAVMLISAAALSAAVADDTYSLKRVAKEGDAAKFRIEMKMEVMGQAVSFSSNLSEKVSKVTDGGGWVTDATMSETKVEFGGQSMDQPSQSEKRTYDGFGHLVDFSSSQGGDDGAKFAYTMEALNSLIAPDKPVKIGDSWTVESKASEKNGKVGSKAKYTLAGKESMGGQDVLKVTMVASQMEGGSASSDMTFWVDAKTFGTIKQSGKLKGLQFPGAPGPMDADETVTRVKS